MNALSIAQARFLQASFWTLMFITPAWSWAQSASVSGTVDWSVEDRQRLQFSPQMALGLYVKASDSYLVTLFATPLSPAEQKHWLSRAAMIHRGKFEGRAHAPDAALDPGVNQALAQSVTVWGKLSDSLVNNDKRGASLEAADFNGVSLCVGRNCNYFSGGVAGDEFKAQFKRLSLPLAASGTARLELAIQQSDAQSITVKADAPFFIVND